jgi:30S ribosomal protein S31
MGKGDLKTKRGKIHNGSYGKHRPYRVKSAAVPTAAAAKKKTKKA